MRVAPIKVVEEVKKKYVPPTDNSYTPRYDPEIKEELRKLSDKDIFFTYFNSQGVREQKELIKELKSNHKRASQVSKDLQAEIDEIVDIFCS